MYHQRQLTMQRPDTTNAKSCKKKGKKPSTRCFDEFNDPDSSDEEQQAEEDAVVVKTEKC